VLSRTPRVLDAMLSGLSDEWLYGNEGPGTWSPVEVVGHLIINEETNFLSRAKLILSEGAIKTLTPIDMAAHLERFDEVPVDQLLQLFRELRTENIRMLQSLAPSAADLTKTAIHPKVGLVQLSHVLATWVAHDLIHIGQVSRVMAKQYKQEVGPFLEFLPRLK
jgi:DinB superfamily